MSLFWKYKIDHILFWMATVLFYGFVNASLIHSAGFFNYLSDVIIRNFLLALICYLNIYYFFPKFFRPSKYALYVLSIAGSLVFYTAVKNAYDIFLYGYILQDHARQQYFYNTYYNFSIALFYLIFSLTLDLSRKWYKQQLLLQQTQMEKLTTELNYLKAQMNPHFLFNSINSIFFQIDKSNHKARESLQIFSDMLRYQLYECTEPEIPIEKEIAYLESYVSLQRLRKDEKDLISFTAEPSASNYSIPPLLLIPFVENAFKHGSSTNGHTGFINIKLKCEDQFMMLDVENSINNEEKANSQGGIGLKNVKRRLELLYQDRHQLIVEKKGDKFLVHLKIQL